MKRWRSRILLYSLPTLLLIAAIAIQVVMWTDYPRRIVLSLVQQQLGLRVQAAGMSTGWTGATTLRDVKLSLPLASDSFLDVPTMSIAHTSLIPLLVTQHLELKTIELDKPTLVVRRDSAGRWNLQDVAELLAKATAGTPEPGTKKRPPKLPRLRLIDGTINVLERDGRKAVIAPLNVTGNPDGLLVYRYDAEVPERLKAVGQVAPGENWKHEARLHLDPGDWLQPWMMPVPTPLVVNANWSGIVNDGKLVGRLVLEEAKYKSYAAHGRVVVQTSGGDTILNPDQFIVTTPLDALPTVQLNSGQIQVHGMTVSAQAVKVTAVGGEALVDANVDLAKNAADLNAIWLDLTAPGEIRHSGNLALHVLSPFPGGPQINGTFVTRGLLPQGKWDGQVKIAGIGRSWSDIDWTLHTEHMAWNSKIPLWIDNLTARITQRERMITLAEVGWPGHQVFGNGRYDLSDKTWSLRLSGQETAGTTYDFNLDANGDRDRTNLNELMVRARGLDVKAAGSFVSAAKKPIDLRIFITHTPQEFAESATNEEPICRGTLLAEGHLDGTITPFLMDFTGTMRSRDLVLLKRNLGDVRGVIKGNVTKEEGDFSIQELSLLGGGWQVKGTWPYHGNDKLVDAEGPLHISVVSKNVALAELGDLLGAKGLSGTSSGEWKIDIPVPRPRRDAIAMAGQFHATAVAMGAFHADDITGTTTLRDGILRADPIVLRRTQRDVTGTTTLKLRTTLIAPDRPTLELTAENWPVALSETSLASITADAQLAIDGKTRSATGPVTAHATFATTQQSIGDASIEAVIDGRIATVEKIIASAAGGHAEGRGTVDADDPNKTTLTLAWSNISGQRLGELLPQLNGLDGTYGGALAIAPATAERALEPLRVTLGVTPIGGRFRAAEIGPMKLSAFVNVSPDFKLERLILDQLPSEIRAAQQRERELNAQDVPLKDRPLDWNDFRIADGRIRIWGRRGRHQLGQIQTHFITQFTHLDVDQLVHVFKADEKPMPSRLNGTITIHGNSADKNLILGEGDLELVDSDLGNFAPLALLYNLMHVGGTTRPTGHGTLGLSLQTSTLSMRNIRYFNRGVEARAASIDISRLWDAPDSPIEGFIVGSARPFADLKLPLLADVDQILSVVQSGLTAVKVEGTLHNVKSRGAQFDELGDSLKRLIVGDVHASKGQTPSSK